MHVPVVVNDEGDVFTTGNLTLLSPTGNGYKLHIVQGLGAEAGAPLAADARIGERLFAANRDNRYVYAVVSRRARGLSIGGNMNPDKRCNFDCVHCYCVRRGGRPELDAAIVPPSGPLVTTL